MLSFTHYHVHMYTPVLPLLDQSTAHVRADKQVAGWCKHSPEPVHNRESSKFELTVNQISTLGYINLCMTNMILVKAARK